MDVIGCVKKKGYFEIEEFCLDSFNIILKTICFRENKYVNTLNDL